MDLGWNSNCEVTGNKTMKFQGELGYLLSISLYPKSQFLFLTGSSHFFPSSIFEKPREHQENLRKPRLTWKNLVKS